MSTVAIQPECTWHFAPLSDTPGDELATLHVDGELTVRILVSEKPTIHGPASNAIEAWIIDQGLPVRGVVADTLRSAVRQIERQRLEWEALTEDQKQTFVAQALWRESFYGSAYKCQR